MDHSKMNECYNAIIEKRNRNKILISYKLKQLNTDFLLPLRKRVLEHKVTKLEMIDDLDCIYGAPKMNMDMGGGC